MNDKKRFLFSFFLGVTSIVDLSEIAVMNEIDGLWNVMFSKKIRERDVSVIALVKSSIDDMRIEKSMRFSSHITSRFQCKGSSS